MKVIDICKICEDLEQKDPRCKEFNERMKKKINKLYGKGVK